jgi:hypothetical protein
MKATLRTSAIALLCGGVLGFLIAQLAISRTAEPLRPVPKSDSLQSDEPKSLRSQIAILETTIGRLQEENRILQERCQELEDINELGLDRAAAIENLKAQWVKEIIDRPGDLSGPQTRLSSLQRRYHLTADQMLQLRPLVEKQERLSKIFMLRHAGLISEDEFNRQMSEMKAFNFDQEVANLLSEEQKERYLEHQNAQHDRGLNIAAYSFSERYNITNPDRFSQEQQTAIQGLFKRALDAPQDLEIPQSIQDLDINMIEKRMLSLGYEELDAETFEKMYEAFVEYYENR